MFAATTCAFLDLETPLKPPRRKAVTTSLLTQSCSCPLKTFAACTQDLSSESCLERLAKPTPTAAQRQRCPNFQQATVALEEGFASCQLSNIGQITFLPHSTSQPTSPLMHSHTPHATTRCVLAPQAAGQAGQSVGRFGVPGHSHDMGASFGPASTPSPWCSRRSLPPSPSLTAHRNFTCS